MTAHAGNRLSNPQEGFALLYVIWIVASMAVVLGIVTSAGQRTARTESARLASMVEGRQLVNLLDIVVRYTTEFDAQLDRRYVAFQRVLTERAKDLAESDNRMVTLRALLAQMRMRLDIEEPTRPGASPEAADATKIVESAGGKQTRIYLPRRDPYKLTVGNTSYQITVTPSNARPNLNRLDPAAIRRYLIYLGVPSEHAARLSALLADWKDSDDALRDGGAEEFEYSARGLKQRPMNRAFASWEEVAHVLDVGPSTLRLLRENFTLHGKQATVARRYVAPGAIAALSDHSVDLVNGVLAQMDRVRTESETALALSVEEAAIKGVMTDTEEIEVVTIRIRGPHRTITAELNLPDRMLLGWYLD